MSNPIKVGIIGTGIFAFRHLRAYAAIGSDKFQIVACCNRSRDKAEKFAKEVSLLLPKYSLRVYIVISNFILNVYICFFK